MFDPRLIFPGISLLFLFWERIIPRRKQPFWRSGLLTDVCHMAFNAYVFGYLYALGLGWVSEHFSLISMGWRYIESIRMLSEQPLWVQVPLLLLLKDLLQYFTHRMLHRVPIFWEFHKVHHSITVMDWMGNMRYHWLEPIVYSAIQYTPLALCGFDWRVFLWMGAFDLFMGYFNHSNLAVNLGPLRYIFNSPGMHIHHHSADIPPCNFGVNLSIWDWMFGTAYYPDRDAERLGFKGIDSYPDTWLGQVLFPLSLLFRKKP